MPLGRVNWVDHAKGACIILVVALFTTQGLIASGMQSGWMGWVMSWAQPFLMPAFFFLAALFLNRTLFGPSRHYIDRKILHFVYFYAVWLVLQDAVLNSELLLTAPHIFLGNLLNALVEPRDSLLLVYMLTVFHGATWLLRRMPARKVFAVAALLQMGFATGWIDTGSLVLNEFGRWYVFFFAGFVAAPVIFEMAERVAGHTAQTWRVLIGWAVANAAFVGLHVAGLPLISLALGFAGTGAMIAFGLMLSHVKWLSIIGYAGRHCLIIYLTCAIPVTLMQRGLIAKGEMDHAGLIALATALVAVALSLAFHRLVRGTPLNVLYRRPMRLRIKAAKFSRSSGLLPPPPTAA
ncbi:acyltransferase family protein [Hyphomonas oceanitis]|uniref:acyltransferase family protein n=1 Tax=Hyphomonas oceanitis TaxID=81033 RepID=UPI003002FCED